MSTGFIVMFHIEVAFLSPQTRKLPHSTQPWALMGNAFHSNAKAFATDFHSNVKHESTLHICFPVGVESIPMSFHGNADVVLGGNEFGDRLAVYHSLPEVLWIQK